MINRSCSLRRCYKAKTTWLRCGCILLMTHTRSVFPDVELIARISPGDQFINVQYALGGGQQKVAR